MLEHSNEYYFALSNRKSKLISGSNTVLPYTEILH